MLEDGPDVAVSTLVLGPYLCTAVGLARGRVLQPRPVPVELNRVLERVGAEVDLGEQHAQDLEIHHGARAVGIGAAMLAGSDDYGFVAAALEACDERGPGVVVFAGKDFRLDKGRVAVGFLHRLVDLFLDPERGIFGIFWLVLACWADNVAPQGHVLTHSFHVER